MVPNDMWKYSAKPTQLKYSFAMSCIIEGLYLFCFHNNL